MTKKVLNLGMIILLSIGIVGPVYSKGPESKDEIIQAIQSFRKERDHFFKNEPNSPLEESDKIHFKRLNYFPVDLKYRFEGKIERYIININDPKYYSTFPTNKGPKSDTYDMENSDLRLKGRNIPCNFTNRS